MTACRRYRMISDRTFVLQNEIVMFSVVARSRCDESASPTAFSPCEVPHGKLQRRRSDADDLMSDAAEGLLGLIVADFAPMV